MPNRSRITQIKKNNSLVYKQSNEIERAAEVGVELALARLKLERSEQPTSLTGNR